MALRPGNFKSPVYTIPPLTRDVCVSVANIESIVDLCYIRATHYLGLRGCITMAVCKLPKLETGVRFPSSAPRNLPRRDLGRSLERDSYVLKK